jgi:hypothetical protein
MTVPLIDSEQMRRTMDALNTRHGRMLRDESFSLSAQLEEGSVMVRVMLERRDRSFSYEMYCAKAVPEDELLSVEETLHLCLDFIDWYLGEYFSSERSMLLPLDWQAHRFGEVEVLAKGDVRNPSLDEAADAWLRGER